MASAWVQFRDKFTAILGIGVQFVLPILTTVVPALKLPAWVGTVAGNLIPQLMAIAEANSPAPGTGPAKKQQVLNAADEIMAVLAKTFTGGAATNFEALKPTISVLIDQTITAVNALAPQIIADDPLVPPEPMGN